MKKIRGKNTMKRKELIKKSSVVATAVFAAAVISANPVKAANTEENSSDFVVAEQTQENDDSISAEITGEEIAESNEEAQEETQDETQNETDPVSLENKETSDDIQVTEQTLQNGWVKIDGFYYYEKDGEIQYNQFISEGNDVYYVNSEGRMVTGEEFDSTSKNPVTGKEELCWYYADESGKLITGWRESADGQTFYYANDYTRAKGFATIDGIDYFFEKESGCLCRNQEIHEWEDGICFKYRTDQDGRLVKGWYRDEETGQDAYYNQKGQGAYGLTEIDGTLYYFSDAIPVKNYLLIENGITYYFGEDGKLSGKRDTDEDGWLKTDDGWRYLKDKALVRNRFLKLNGDLYYFGSYGDLFRGWETTIQLEDGSYGTFRADENGKIITGWYGDDQYYASDGRKQKGITKIDNVFYYFNRDGFLQKNWDVEEQDTETGETVYYRTDEKGRLIKGLYTDEYGDSYYCGDDFQRKSGIYTVNGKTYCFDPFLRKEYFTAENGYSYYFDENGELTQKKKIAKDGWCDVKGQWYYIKDNAVLRQQFIKRNNKIYYLNEDGQLVKDQTIYIYNEEKNKNIYYKATEDGSLVTGWDGNDYFLSDGSSADGILQIDGKTYYFENGLRRDCVVAIDGYCYYFDENGDMRKKQDARKDCWFQVNNNWYYVRNGEVVINDFVTVNNKKYYMEYEGKMYRDVGFSVYDSTENKEFTYYADKSGVLVTGWRQFSGDVWYYYDESGRQQNGLITINGLMYDLTPEMQKNTAALKDGVLYYFASDGISTIFQKAPKTGWVQMMDDWYYVKNNSLVKSERIKIDGYDYVFDLNGKMIRDDIYQDRSSGIAVYRINHQGHASLVTGWMQIQDDPYYAGAWYYFNEKGYPIGGLRTINGKTYYIADDGMVSDQTIVETDSKDGKRYLYYFGKDGVLKGKTVFNPNGLMKISGSCYYAEYGILVRNAWHLIDNEAYYFGANGKMYVNQYWKDPRTGEEYYFGADGKQHETGWYRSSTGNWIYRDKNGSFLSGAHKVNGTIYYFKNGEMCTNLKTVYKNVLYQIGADGKGTAITEKGWNGDYYIQNGKITTGWKYINKKWYFFSSQGTKCRTENDRDDKYYVDGNYYYLLSDGTMLKGWIKNQTGVWYYADNTGKLKENGWLKINNNEWYYFKDEAMMTGVSYIESAYQLFDQSGRWIRKLTTKDNGWIKCGQIYYYVEKGVPVKGKEKEINGKWYSFDSEGKMRSAQKYVDTETNTAYYLEKTGAALQNKWLEVEKGKFWYFEADGKAVKSGWKKIAGKWYYFENFCRVTGSRIIQNKKYDFGTDGVWTGTSEHFVKGWKDIQGFYYYWDQRLLKGIHRIDGQKYYFDADGKMAYAQIVYDTLSKAYYYATANGDLAVSKWCNAGMSYAGADGRLYTGVHTINGKKYAFSDDGVLRKEDMISEDGTEVYLVSKSGEITKTLKAGNNGWVKTTKGTWYMVQNGVFLHDQIYCNENGAYYFKENGVLMTNDSKAGIGFSDKNGVLSTRGWNAEKYWVDDSTTPSTVNRAIDINGKFYYFKDGVVSDGLYFVDGSYYLYTKSGTRTKKTLSTGWNQEGTNWYYKNEDGSLAAGCIQKIGQNYYEFAEDGKMLKDIFNGDHFYDQNGVMLCLSLKEIDGIWYYFDQNGNKVTGKMRINGKNYLFDRDGKMI